MPIFAIEINEKTKKPMIHYFDQLSQTMKTGWNSKAVCNWNGESFTYGELAAQIEKFHIFFDKIGLKKGDKVTLFAANSARWAVTFLSINTYETVVVPLLSEFTPDAASNLTDHSESTVIFADTELWQKMNKEAMPKIRCAISNNDYSILYADDEIKAAYESVEAAFAEKYPNGFTAADVKYPNDNWKDLALINYTSGTTSSPKGVMLSYENISASIDFAIRHIPASTEDSIVSMLPMGHIYGLVIEFMYPVCCGVNVNFLGKAPAASTLLKAVADVKPYLVITVPLVMEKVYKSSLKPVLSKPAMKVLLAIPGINNILYGVVRKKLLSAFGGKVKQFIMGGAALNPDVEKVFRNMKLPYTVGYGMTEAAPLLAYEYPCKFLPGSCGKSVDSADVRIDSEDPEHVPGEIQAKGANICMGYFNNPEASANAFTDDGYLHTGDLGTMDKDGNIVIRGRSKNMILSPNGQNIYPEEVEAVINAQEWVVESVVVSREHKLVALVYFDQAGMRKAGLDAAAVEAVKLDVMKLSNKILPKYSQLTKIEAVDEPFVKTPKMSIKRFMYK